MEKQLCFLPVARVVNVDIEIKNDIIPMNMHLVAITPYFLEAFHTSLITMEVKNNYKNGISDRIEVQSLANSSPTKI